MNKHNTVLLLPCILAVALLSGCATEERVLTDDAALPAGPSVTYEQAIGLAQSAEDDLFNEVAANYRATNPKPQLPEEARKFKVQAEFAVQEKQFDKAAELYGQALEIAPWWPQGHFNRAIILGELKKYHDAIREMKRYVSLVPGAPDARAAQDKVYQWESMAPSEAIEFRDCPDCPVMVSIPGKSYAIGKYEVTQAQWQAVMGNNPAHFKSANRPVEQVSWNDAQEYIKKLNQKTGKRYRLPTEAEWEYACYGGSQTEYCGGTDANRVAWYSDNSGGQTHTVGQKQANGYGLYDMSGNVWEWMENKYDDGRVLRGGAWIYGTDNLRAALRKGSDPGERFYSLGFRVARTLP